jgi:acetate kinase
MKNILVANAGSSSVKFQVFAVDGSGKLARMIGSSSMRAVSRLVDSANLSN